MAKVFIEDVIPKAIINNPGHPLHSEECWICRKDKMKHRYVCTFPHEGHRVERRVWKEFLISIDDHKWPT